MRICWSFSRSKPSLTIAPEFEKTIEKPLISMVDLQKTFNGDGPGMVKPSKNHRWQWCLGKKTLPSHHYENMTIVEV